jgi:twitching motility protein PilJ
MATASGSAFADNRLLVLLALAGSLLLGALVVLGVRDLKAPPPGGGTMDLRDTLVSLSRAGQEAGRGAVPDAGHLAALANRVDAAVASLPRGPDTDAAREAFGTAWGSMKEPVRTLQEQAAAYARAATNLKAIQDAVGPALGVYDEALDLVSRGGSNNDVPGVSRQLVRLHRIQSLARQTLGSGADASVSLPALTAEMSAFRDAHRALTSAGTIEREKAKIVLDGFATAETAIAAVQQDLQALAAVQAAAAALPALEQQALAAAAPLSAFTPAGAPEGSRLVVWLAIGAGTLGLLLAAVYTVIAVRNARAAAAAQRAQEEAQQQAILSLLDEITNLANGDLTGELTVTADFTGNIADSLNYTVQTLRGLVGTINDTSVEIAAAASSTTGRVQQMSTAAEGQAREVVRANQAINAASRSLEEVASRAERIAEQAKGSVETAHSGAATVGRTIAGMSQLREQIQDTAKRIKRLGESSQEIGNIIEIIDDIAEQTNMLALNASIQAATAGEAGRGFAVVADQVRQLAERAGSATRQIENLIKTIQADTQEAITSMERSTANVVGGAKSAEEAGLALTRIESSSQELARVIQEIAGASRQQSAETTRLAGVMQGIREVSVQTSVTAHQTTEAVNELNTLSAKLRESVAGFKLPVESQL